MWFEEKQHQIENLDQQLRKLLASVESFVLHRKELAANTGAFAKSAVMLGNIKEPIALSCALSQLAEIEERIKSVHSQQGGQHFFLLFELLKDYISLIGAVKGVFHQRDKVCQTWQHAQQILTEKREQKAKLEMAGKSDKVPQAKGEVIEWEAEAERGREEFEKISKMILKEVERFERSRAHDFQVQLVKYVESLLENQEQLPAVQVHMGTASGCTISAGFSLSGFSNILRSTDLTSAYCKETAEDVIQASITQVLNGQRTYNSFSIPDFPPYNCFLCPFDFGFETQERYVAHLKQSHIRGHFCCKSCSHYFNSFRLLAKHEENVHKSKRIFACVNCQKDYVDVDEFDHHIC